MSCIDCILTPSFSTRFEATIDRVCSGICGRIPAHRPDFFEQVVGVGLDDWIAARTPDELDALLASRDAR